MTGFPHFYWVVSKQHKLVLTILLKRRQFCPSAVGTGTFAFFYIYINDISTSTDQLKFYLFADDTHVLYADRNHGELSNVYDWLTANKLSLNIKKSNIVIFRPRQKKLNYEVNLKVFDHQSNRYNISSLKRKKYVKYLGVLIDETLSWKYHIVHLASKISKTIGIIASLRHFVPLATLHHIIYISLI